MNASIKNAIGDLLFWRDALTQLQSGKVISEPFTEDHAQDRLDYSSRKLALAVEAFGGIPQETAPNIEIIAATWNLYQNGEITFDSLMLPHYSPMALCQLGELISKEDLIRVPFSDSIAFTAIYGEHVNSLCAPLKLVVTH